MTLQNRGTATLINTLLEVWTPAGLKTLNATTIAPGSIKTFTLPFAARSGEAYEVTAKASLGTPGQDPTPENNLRKDFFR